MAVFHKAKTYKICKYLHILLNLNNLIKNGLEFNTQVFLDLKFAVQTHGGDVLFLACC